MARGKNRRRIEPRFEQRPVISRALPKNQAAAPGPARKRRRKSARRPAIRRVRGLVYWGTVLFLWGLVGFVALVGYFAAQLPQMSTWAVPERPPNVRIVTAEGHLLANRGMTGGESLRLDEMSPWLPAAVIAIEDRRFRDHFGIDPLGLGRAMLANLAAGRISQGGSTITQQLAKNLFLEPERTVERKVQEAVLAFWLETRFEKDDILELYLNRVYFGAGAWGVDAAAQAYFGKSARDLSLGESALLAGLVKAPSRLNPKQDPEAAAERARLVLDAMEREGMITIAQARNALSTSRAEALALRRGGRHFAADMVMDELVKLLPDEKADLIVETTIRVTLQSAAERSVAKELDASGEKLRVSQAALIALDEEGAVLAVIGGRDYSRSQFNRAVNAKRQPGSAFKPFVFLAALEAGETPGDVRQDAPVRIGNWRPENYDRKYRGPVTLTYALSQSLNTVAARLVGEFGANNVVRVARRLGIASPLQQNASIALGTSEVSLLELTGAYDAFANGGKLVTHYAIRRVMTARGKILFERREPEAPRVIGDREIAMMNEMLAETVVSGTARAARMQGRQVAGKTGTTQNFRDAWFIGYVANLAAGVWVGNDDGAPMDKVTGGGMPARIWAQFMREAIREVPPLPLYGTGMPEVAALPVARPQRELEPPRRRTGDEALLPGREVGGGLPPRKPNFLELLFGG